MGVYVGIDAGGTKTEVQIYHPEAGVSQQVTGGAGNVNSVGWETAVERMSGLVREALAAKGLGDSAVSAVCIGAAGIGAPGSAAEMKRRLAAAGGWSTTKVEAVIDPLIALTAGTAGVPGVVVIAGTGSIAAGEDHAGRSSRSGGYGYLIGDEGSGFDIGKAGIQAALASFDGRGPATRLWEAVTDEYGVTSPLELVPLVYQAEHPVGQVASFAKRVLELAGTDTVASSIVDMAAQAHARLVEGVRSKLPGTDAGVIVLAGSLYMKSDALLQRVQRLLPGEQLTVLTRRPVSGAVLRAMLLEVPVADEVVKQAVRNNWLDWVNRIS